MALKSWCSVVVVLSMSFLAACGGAPVQTAAPNAAEDVTKVTAMPAELVIYDSSGSKLEQLMSRYGDKLKMKFPNYTFTIIPKVNNKTLGEQLLAGTTVDIVVESTGVNLFEFELQSDISDMIAKYKVDLNRLEPTTIEYQRALAGGGIYGLPFATTSMIVFYNKDLFDKFGVPYPKDGSTWDELYELARKMSKTENGVNYKGFTMAFEHALMLNQHSAQSQDPKTGKAAFMNENFVKAFENHTRFYQIKENGLPGNRFFLNNQQNPFYKTQTSAMYYTLTGAAKTFADTVNWDIIAAPVLKEKPGIGSQTYPTYFWLTKASKNRDAAFQVVNYVTSEEFQQYSVRSGEISILKDRSVMNNFGADLAYMKGKNLKAMLPAQYAHPTLKTMYNAIANKELLAALEAVSKGADMNTALREASERNDKQVAEAAGAGK